MARIENTVFISYRRTDVYTALAVYENLKNQGYDVFFDYRSISSGDFEQIITSNIRARAHFLLILTSTALDRCNEPGDWLRREIELAIDEKRNIVPLFFKGFRFGNPSVAEQLTGKLKNLSRYNGLNVHEDYFDEAMERVRTQYLNIPLDTVLHPVSTEVQKVVRAEQVAADNALEQIVDVKKLVKQAEEKPDPLKAKLAPGPIVPPHKQQREVEAELEGLKSQAIQYELRGDFWNALQAYYQIKKLDPLFPRVDIKIRELERAWRPKPIPVEVRRPIPSGQPNLRLVGLAVGAIAIIVVIMWVARSGFFSPNPNDSATRTPEKDGMVMIYVPAGEFTMGSDNGDADERPVHKVNLDGFWIDQTEVTNAQFAKFIDETGYKTDAEKVGCLYILDVPTGEWNCLAGITWNHPQGSASTLDGLDMHPIVQVSWNDANAYCAWADRRLPTEAQWEKAARGEGTSLYPWGNRLDETRANFCDTNCVFNIWSDKDSNDGFPYTSPVGNYSAGVSPYGVLDMAGNVLEWVADEYGSRYYENSPSSNPTGPENPDSGTGHVLRGGSWGGYFRNDSENVINSMNVSSTHRRWGTNDLATNFIGFRCADLP